MINIHAMMNLDYKHYKDIYDKTHMNPLYILENYMYKSFKKPLKNNFNEEKYII